MIRTLLATTAIAALLTTGAMAQTTTAPADDPAAAPMTDTAPADATETPGPQAIEGHLATNIIGENVYNSVGDDAENIGTINDIVLDPEGRAELIVVGVGGFLGLGQKDVALQYNEIEWAARDDGSVWLVVPTTREQLEQQEEFDRDLYDPNDPASMAATGGTAAGGAATDGTAAAPAGDTTAPADGAATTAPAGDTTTDTTTAPADDATTAPTDDAATAPADGAATGGTAAAPATDGTAGTTGETAAVDRETLTEVDAASLSADELIGTTVYGANDENVGSISDVILDGDTVSAVTIDVGGFLGMGTKQVAVAMDNLAFMSDENNNYYLYTPFTQEQLEAQPEYDEATYTEQRDQQTLTAPAN